MRERLIELIKDELSISAVNNGEFIETTANVEEVADHLIANGVIVPLEIDGERNDTNG